MFKYVISFDKKVTNPPTSFATTFNIELRKANSEFVINERKKNEDIKKKVLNVCFNDYLSRNTQDLIRHANSGGNVIRTQNDKIFQKCVTNIINESDFAIDDYGLYDEKYDGFHITYRAKTNHLCIGW